MMYFVIGIHPKSGRPIPIMDGSDEDIDDRVALFNTKKEARTMALDQPICQSGGYTIQEWEYME